MNIAKHTVASIHYTLTTDEGEVIDSSRGGVPLEYLHGAGNLIPGLESELEGRSSGDEFQVRIPAEKGYGSRNDAQVQKVPRDHLPQGELQVGMQLRAEGPEGAFVVTIAEIGEEEVTLDANHPLAGVDLNFDVAVVDVREATDEEKSHGHVHGPDGHEH